MISISEEMRKSMNIVEYRIDKPSINEINIPEIPEWAYKLSAAFETHSFSQIEVEKNVQKMVEKVNVLR